MLVNLQDPRCHSFPLIQSLHSLHQAIPSIQLLHQNKLVEMVIEKNELTQLHFHATHEFHLASLFFVFRVKLMWDLIHELR